MQKMPVVAAKKVWLSGAALLNASASIMPLAPALLSNSAVRPS
jgi:hypothetical protein